MKTNKGNKQASAKTQVENVQVLAQVENTQAVYILDENGVQQVKQASKTIVADNKDFRRQLDTNLMILERQYKELESTRKAFDYLAHVTSTPVENFFKADFVRKLYKTCEFRTLDENGTPNGVYTCIAETHKKTDKTNWERLATQAANNTGETLDIAHTLDEKSGLYYTPIYNFTASNILRYLQKIDSYVISLANYRTKKASEARKAKKAQKKAAKAQAAQAAQGEANAAA